MVDLKQTASSTNKPILTSFDLINYANNKTPLERMVLLNKSGPVKTNMPKVSEFEKFSIENYKPDTEVTIWDNWGTGKNNSVKTTSSKVNEFYSYVGFDAVNKTIDELAKNYDTYTLAKQVNSLRGRVQNRQLQDAFGKNVLQFQNNKTNLLTDVELHLYESALNRRSKKENPDGAKSSKQAPELFWGVEEEQKFQNMYDADFYAEAYKVAVSKDYKAIKSKRDSTADKRERLLYDTAMQYKMRMDEEDAMKVMLSKAREMQNKYGIDIWNFTMEDFEKWSEEHNFETSYIWDFSGEEPKSEKLTAPKYEGGFFGIGGKKMTTDEEDKDLLTLKALAQYNERVKSSQEDNGAALTYLINALNAFSLGMGVYKTDQDALRIHTNGGLPKESFVSFDEVNALSEQLHPIAANVGDLTGTVTNAVVLAPLFSVFGTEGLATGHRILGAMTQQGAYGMFRGAVTEFSHGGSVNDIILNSGREGFTASIGALGGAGVEKVMGTLFTNPKYVGRVFHALKDSKITSGIIETTGGLADASVDALADHAFVEVTNMAGADLEHRTSGDLITDYIVSLLFGMGNAIYNTKSLSAESRAYLKSEVDKYVADYKTISKTALKTEDVNAYINLAEGLIAQGEDLKTYLKEHMFPGQKDMVKIINEMIDEVNINVKKNVEAIKTQESKPKKIIPTTEFSNVTTNTLPEYIKAGDSAFEHQYSSGIFDINIGTTKNFATQSDVDDYVDYAYRYASETTVNGNKNFPKQKSNIVIGKTNGKLVFDLKENFGIDVSDAYHTINDNDIRHIKNSHGEGTNEKYPVTAEDIKQIPDIINNYDDVLYAENGGKKGIYYVKRHNGVTYYLEAINESGKVLSNKQMIKVATGTIPNIAGLKDAINKKWNISSAPDDLRIPRMYVHDVWNDNVPNNNIPQNSNLVNVSYDVDMAIGRYLSGEATMEDANLFLPGNTANRQAFYEATGIRLPDTVGGIQSILISTNLPEYIKAMDEITASQKNAKLIEIYKDLEKVSRKPDSLTGKNESGIINKNNYSVATSRYINKNDPLYINSKKIIPLEGFEDIVTHGDAYSIVFMDADGKETNVSAKEFVEILKKDLNYKGGNIRLISCEVGSGEGIVPQYVANELNIDVLAPTEKVWVFEDGTMVVTNDKNNALSGIDTGEWNLFKPKRK